MPHGSITALSLLLITFIIAVIVLAILWRISLALDKIADHLEKLAADRKESGEIEKTGS